MKTLSRSVGRPDIGGEPMPTVFRTFETNQIVIRRSEVSVIAGTPGAGKSTLALALAHAYRYQHCTYQQIPTHTLWLCVCIQ